MHKKILSFYGIAITLGIMTGFVCSCFQWSINLISHWIVILVRLATAHGLSAGLVSAFITMILVFVASYLVKRFAPEASGSGVPEIEGALLHKRPIYWKRLLPVKFIGGVLAISAKMVLGREGPSIQLGGNLGDLLATSYRVSPKRRDVLIAAGAAAGLAAAFNAPIAGILFILEEMREHMRFSFLNFKAMAVACMMSTIVMQLVLGSKPPIIMPLYGTPNLSTLVIFFLFGLVVGLVGLLFNITLVKGMNIVSRFHLLNRVWYILGIAAIVGALAYIEPNLVGGGYEIIEQSIETTPSFKLLLGLLSLRFILTILCYTTGVPGGIFAPLLALGTLLGMAFFQVIPSDYLTETAQQGMFAVAGMGGLFAAAVGAPITGVVLVVEMTQNYSLILPMMVTCLTATMIMQLAHNPPIYTQLLNRVLRQSR